MVVKRGDKIEAKSEAPPTMTVGFLKETKDFELTDDMFSEDALFS